MFKVQGVQLRITQYKSFTATMGAFAAIYGGMAFCMLIICLISLRFGVLFLDNAFDVSASVKYGVGITILVVGIIGSFVSFLIVCAVCSGTGSGGSDRRIRMLAVQSGMNLTERHDFRQNANKLQISKELLIKMLTRENELRLSKETLQEYEDEAQRCYDINDPKRHGLHIIDNLQKRVVNEFGFVAPQEEMHALEYLRSAVALYPGDGTIKNAANYLKYNLVKTFPFNIDDIYKDINLLDLNNNLIKLSQIIKRDVLNVIISGSIT